ncbi:hypothetical protein Tco_0655686 [Tanacetum coccineum]|uniref:Uncharacterized protein n=1 Tax=Tanacetum coccineum TaxID=301880 RepID=A0ABQ4X6P9_9ASTR
MSSSSLVTYTSISSNSDRLSWGIPLMDVGKLPEMNPYEEVSQQGQATPPSPAYMMIFQSRISLCLADASLASLSLRYVADSNLKEDPEEDPKEDHADYPANRGDDDDEPSDDDDDDEELLALPTLPPSPLTLLSSSFPQIPSPPLPVPSPPLPLPSPTTSPTYVEVPLGYRAAKIQLRPASPPPLLPSTTHRDDLPGADMPLQKRARFITPTHRRSEIGESSAAAAR